MGHHDRVARSDLSGVGSDFHGDLTEADTNTRRRQEQTFRKSASDPQWTLTCRALVALGAVCPNGARGHQPRSRVRLTYLEWSTGRSQFGSLSCDRICRNARIISCTGLALGGGRSVGDLASAAYPVVAQMPSERCGCQFVPVG